MSLTNVNTYRIEKEYQQYYNNAKLRCRVHLEPNKSLRETYVQDWIKLLTENANR